MKTQARSASLRLQLLRRLVPVLIILLLAGALTAYWVAWRSATRAYDRALLDTALAISEQLQVSSRQVHLPLTQQARTVLLTDKFDRIFYAVRGQQGELLDGEAGLTMPPPEAPRSAGGEGRYYYDSVLNGQPVRIAVLWTHLDGQTVTILAGETHVKRNNLIQEIILGMLVPELLLALASIVLIWFGIRNSLLPLDSLRLELAGRSQADLRPVQIEVPEEIQPVLTEINELLHRLKHALSSQRNFVSDAAHQLRTPIAALQAQVEATAREAQPETREKLDGVQQACERLTHLVDQMLALARAEPSLAQTQQEVALAPLIQQVAESWLPKAIQKGIDLGFELSPATVRGNPFLLEELLANLLDNAIRHISTAQLITVSCGQSGEIAWLTVEDSGAGIPEAEQEQIFERFYRSPGTHADGNGLGLAIVREIARQHGGQVQVERSDALGGALFRVTLPSTGTH